MEKDYKVYMHIFPDGKKYIGITKNDPERRWNNGNGYSDNSTMKKAIQEVGWENVESVIVKEGLTVVEASELEIELIRASDTTNPEKGYNHHPGGVPYNRTLLEEKNEKLEERNKFLEREIMLLGREIRKYYDSVHNSLDEVCNFINHFNKKTGIDSVAFTVFYISISEYICYLKDDKLNLDRKEESRENDS